MAPGNGWLPAAFVDPKLNTLEGGGGLSHLIIRSEQHVLLVKHGIGGWQMKRFILVLNKMHIQYTSLYI